MSGQVVDPGVSRTKFDREIAQFRARTEEYGRRGWFLIDAAFPKTFVILGAPHVTPPPLVTGVAFDYSDYDVRPPSVRLVDPFTREPYEAGKLPTNLLRQTEVEAPPMIGLALAPGAAAPRMIQQVPLMQAYEGELPFLCVAGVREYHDHPAHSGDHWELHRRAGAGRLVRLLEVIDTYGIRPLHGYNIALVPQIAGFSQGEVPR